jgi:malic enzyme
MAPNPIIFALSNPNPEIHPDLIRAVRKDAIIATGRSDMPNQVNNVLCFPYIFRGALDVRARVITTSMCIAAVHAIRELAKEPALPEVMAAYSGLISLSYGPDYIIPKPMDPRLRERVVPAVAKAAIEAGVAMITN